jgi:hypothetical protein
VFSVQPRDELEGMLGAQMIATHNAAMECFRRAMIKEQSFEGRQQNLEFANKLVRFYTALLKALDQHRGKSSHTWSESSRSRLRPAIRRLWVR